MNVFNPALPTAFNEALSYYEELKCVMSTMKHIESTISGISDDSKAYTDRKFLEMKLYIDGLTGDIKSDFETLKNNIEGQITELTIRFNDEITKAKKYTDDEILKLQKQFVEYLNEIYRTVNELSAKIVKLSLSINAMDEALQKKLQYQIQALYAYVDKHIANASGARILVLNPMRQKVTTLNVALADLYQRIKLLGAITSIEYDSMMLTAKEYDEKHITALQYDTIARFIFLRELYIKPIIGEFDTQFEKLQKEIDANRKEHYMFSPFNGKKELNNKVIYDLSNLHRDALTALAYDSLHLKAYVYDAQHLSAYEYDWNGGGILG